MPRDGPSGRRRARSRALPAAGQAPVQPPDRQRRAGHRRRTCARSAASRRDAGVLASQSGTAAASAPKAAHERAEQAVAGEQRGARVALRRLGQARMLQRQEHADVARTRIERADEGDEQQRPERRQAGEAEAGGDHQQRRAEQQAVRRRSDGPRRRRASVASAEPSSVAVLSDADLQGTEARAPAGRPAAAPPCSRRRRRAGPGRRAGCGPAGRPPRAGASAPAGGSGWAVIGALLRRCQGATLRPESSCPSEHELEPDSSQHEGDGRSQQRLGHLCAEAASRTMTPGTDPSSRLPSKPTSTLPIHKWPVPATMVSGIAWTMSVPTSRAGFMRSG